MQQLANDMISPVNLLVCDMVMEMWSDVNVNEASSIMESLQVGVSRLGIGS